YYADRGLVAEGVAQERQRHVVDRHVALGPSLRLAVVRVTVEDQADRVAVQRLLQPAGPQEGEDGRRLALDGFLDGGIVQHGDTLRRAQPGQGRLQLQGLLDGLIDEVLDDLLAPRFQGVPAEAAAEALDAREADAVQLADVAVEDVDAGVAQDALDLVLLAR